MPVLALSAFVAWGALAPSVLLRAAENATMRGKDALPLYARATEHPWPRADAHEKYGIALFRAHRFTEARDQFQKALAGLDTGGLYLILGAAETQLLNHPEAARTALEECLRRWPSNYEAYALLLRHGPPSDRERILHRAGKWLSAGALQRLEAEGAP